LRFGCWTARDDKINGCWTARDDKINGCWTRVIIFLYLFWAFYKIQKKIHVYKEIPWLGKRLRYSWTSHKIYKIDPVARVAQRNHCWKATKLFSQITGKRGQFLVDLEERILMMVVVLAVNGWWERIGGLKLLLAELFTALFLET
jgi:hypothetical protein